MDIPQRILFSLIQEHGTSIIQDSAKFRNLLIDYYKGKYKKERKCLSDALSEGIPEIFLIKKDQLAYTTLSQQLSQKLIDDLGISPELAKWTVDSWALALGIIQDFPTSQHSVTLANQSHQNAVINRIRSTEEYTISIVSNPQGANVFLNDIFKGVTPLILKNPVFNSYQLQISHEGYESWTQSFEVVSKTDMNITATLAKKPDDTGSTALNASRSFAVRIAINLGIFFGVIGIIFVILFLIGGTWPPLVTIQGESMMPNMNNGDLIFVVQKDRFGELQTWNDGGVSDYKKFGDYGDVIVYRPNGIADYQFRITRAMTWTQPGAPVPLYINFYRGSVTPTGYLPLTVVGTTANGYQVLSTGNTTPLVNYTLGARDVSFSSPQLGNCILPGDAIVKNAGYVKNTGTITTHGGYITKGDNNSNSDQGSLLLESTGTIEPVQKDWVMGKALFAVPYIGLLSLNFGSIIIIFILIIILIEFFRVRKKK